MSTIVYHIQVVTNAPNIREHMKVAFAVCLHPAHCAPWHLLSTDCSSIGPNQKDTWRLKSGNVQGEGVSTPGSGITVGVATVRGVKSFGMICSAYDLDWMDEANGWAAELPGNTEPGHVLGSSPMQVI